MKPQIITRVALAILALVGLQVGFWAAFAPQSFYDDFPSLGRVWVAVDGPYNEHLVRDVGALSLALAVVLAAATATADRRLIRVAAVAFAVYTVPHSLFHGGHLDGFSLSDGVAQMSGFVLQLLLAAAALGSTLERTGGDDCRRP